MVGNKRVFFAMAGVHLALIFSLIFAGMLKGCLPKKEKPKIIAVVSIDPIAVAPMPTPPTPPTPTPKPPEPEVKPPPPPPEPEKPKYKALTPEEIRKRIKKKKIEREFKQDPEKSEPKREEKKKLLSKEDLKNLIDQKVTTNQPKVNSAQTEDAMTEVLLDLQRKAYAAWEKPDGLSSSAGRTTHLQFRVNRFGKVLSCSLVEPSGLTLMDQSVLRAGQAIKSIRRFPPEYVGEEEAFIIIFQLTD